MSVNSIERALSYIPSDDRLLWIRMGAALKSELGNDGFGIWNEWSKGSHKYDERVAHDQWKSIKPGIISIASLYFEAKKYGFNYEKSDYKVLSEAEKEERRRKIEAERKAAEMKRAEEIKQAKNNAQERWNNSVEIDMKNNQYLKSKGLTEFKFLERIIRQDSKNNVVIPIKSFRNIVGIQRITFDGSKFLEKNMQLEGSSLIIGSWSNAKTNGIELAEGLATGATVHAATGKTVVIAFTGHNMTVLAEQLMKNTSMKVNILADNDPKGLEYARKAKEILGDRGVILKPEFSQEDVEKFQAKHKKLPSDFNDLMLIKGLDEVSKQLNEQIIKKKKDNNQNEFIKNQTELKKNKEHNKEANLKGISV